jgi:ATP-binding cassette, subfamily B, heavy metal transporter
MPKENYSSIRLTRDLLGFLKPHKAKFLTASILRILGEVAWLYPAYGLAALTTFFSTYVPGQSLMPFWNIIFLFVLTYVVHFIAVYYANYTGYPIAERTGLDAELQAMKHMLYLDMEWHEKENSGSKTKRIDRGGASVNHLIRMWFGVFIELGVSFGGAILIISRFDKTIALLTLLFIVIYFMISVYYTRNATGTKREENLKDEELASLIFESMNNIRSTKVMSMVNPISERLTKLGDELYEFIRRRIFWYQSGGSVKNLTGQTFRIAILCFIGWGIMQGRYEVGFLVLFYAYFTTIQVAVTKLADTSQDFIVRKQDVARMMNILETKVGTDAEENKVSFPDNWEKVTLTDVSFSYHDKKVLDGISFTISRGEKIGIIGLSGAGKSTLFKLLLKERENYEGEITIDGTPLRSISKSDYFKHTAVVLQDTEVFSFSLRNNITISNSNRQSDQELFDRSLEIAHVSEFAKALPQGADTLIGEKGVKLSGGEKQRVGLARAIFKDPELLLLDEATSHLDVESEKKIQDSLHRFFKSVTALVIAHRLTTIREMDKIIVMEGGKIIEQGNFTELYDKKGRFYELWEKQKLSS